MDDPLKTTFLFAISIPSNKLKLMSRLINLFDFPSNLTVYAWLQRKKQYRPRIEIANLNFKKKLRALKSLDMLFVCVFRLATL